MTSNGIQFLHAFSGVLSTAAMHTYISALPLASSNALLYKNYITESVAERPWVVSMDGQWSCARILRGHDGAVRSVAFSPDGSQIATGSGDQTVQIWDAQTGQVDSEPFRGVGWVWSVAWSPTSPRIASSSRRTVVVWDTNTIEMVASFEGHRNDVFCVAYSPDGSRLASGSRDCEIRIWNANTGKMVGKPLVGHNDYVRSITFSPDGKQIASGSSDRTVRIWDVQTGQTIGEPLRGHANYVFSVAWSPNGYLLASGSDDHTIRLWDIQTRHQLFTLQGHSSAVASVAFSPDGSNLASGSYDGTIRLWDPRSGKCIECMDKPSQGYVHSVAFSPDGQRIASGSYDDTVRVWARKIKIMPSPQPSRIPATTTDTPPIEGTILDYAERVDKDGWICSSMGQRLVWVPFPLGKITVNSDSLIVEGQGDI
jgi:WD40 repeat protein